ncbi:transglycosylase [Rubrivivax gelatinosus]|nr:transglycosylase [Rubrivivax gelatinosus]
MTHQTIPTSIASAASASSTISHMPWILAPRRGRMAAGFAAAALAACSSVPLPPERPAPVEIVPPAPAASTPAAGIERSRSRWVAVDWADLPGWNEDRVAEVWPALRASCGRPAAGWAELCARAQLEPPADDGAARAWLARWLQPWRVETLDGQPEGLATGYFEPLVLATRQPRGEFRVPLYAPPSAAAMPRPGWTRQQLDTLPAARAALRGREIAWVADPLDALLLQVQGSGRLLVDEADGSRRLVRLAFAGHNEQPYKSVGRWLVERGELTLETASWPAIRAWARRNPQRVQELLWANPRVVFFREEPLPDPTVGPRGAQGVPLLPGRSIAVDAASIPYGTPVWLDTTEPLSATPLRRLVMAQDTGSAIVGAVRADYFWGWGADAEAQAGRMKQPLRLWALWPRGARPQ